MAIDAASEAVPALRVTRVVPTALLVSPVRLGAGLAGLGVAVAVGASAGAAALAFATAAAGMALVILNDPRRRLFERGAVEPLPETAVERRLLQSVARAFYPSTLGLAVLVAIAVALDKEMLAALLSGLIAGLGLASLVSGLNVVAQERGAGCEYLAGPDGQVFVRERS